MYLILQTPTHTQSCICLGLQLQHNCHSLQLEELPGHLIQNSWSFCVCMLHAHAHTHVHLLGINQGLWHARQAFCHRVTSLSGLKLISDSVAEDSPVQFSHVLTSSKTGYQLYCISENFQSNSSFHVTLIHLICAHKNLFGWFPLETRSYWVPV